jgi:hypothetical protein
MAFAEKMVLAVFGVSCMHAFVASVPIQVLDSMSLTQIINGQFLQALIVLWMTRSLTDDIPGWAVLFDGRVGDGTVTVSAQNPHPS